MRRLALVLLAIVALMGGVALAAGTTAGPFTFTIDQTVTLDDGSTGHLHGDLTVDVDVPPPPAEPTGCSDGIDNDGDGLIDYPADPGCTDATDNGEFNSTEPPPTETEPPPPTETEPPPPETGEGTLTLVDQKFVCKGPVNYDLVKVTITQTASRMDGAQLGAGCTGRIGRLEIDTWNADGIHVGAYAHDLDIEGGYMTQHGRYSADSTVHFDGVQVMGGQRITFHNYVINALEASNAALYFNTGQAQLDRPTDVVCDGCTIRRSPEDNRTVRIYGSTRSGVRNSTVYACGTAEGCGQGDPINIREDLATDPVNENNTVILTG